MIAPMRFIEFNTFEDIFDQCWKWQDAVFDTTAEHACNGIRKEAKELQHAIEWQTPAQIHIEVADVLMYVIYVAKKYGMNWEDVKHALNTKLEINKARNWRKLEDGTYRHVEPPNKESLNTQAINALLVHDETKERLLLRTLYSMMVYTEYVMLFGILSNERYKDYLTWWCELEIKEALRRAENLVITRHHKRIVNGITYTRS